MRVKRKRLPMLPIGCFNDSRDGVVRWRKLDRRWRSIAAHLLRCVCTPGGEDDPLLQSLTVQQWVPDVSSASFRELVASRDRQDTSVTRIGSLLEVHYPFASGDISGISEAMLTVNGKDF